jgi:hypothetical protein
MKDSNINALLYASIALIKLINENSLNNNDGSQSVDIKYRFQALTLCRLGLGKPIGRDKYMFEFEKLNKNIISILNKIKIKGDSNE